LDFEIRMDSSSMLRERKFRIFRKTGQAEDTQDAFEWDPPRDSDELFAALKHEFPQLKTLRDRMREALIEFLVQERESAKNNLQTNSSREGSSSYITPRMVDAPDSGMTNNMALYSQDFHTRLDRSGSIAKIPHRERLPKAWDGMTVIWSRKTGVVRKPGPKREMTEQEREEYRLRRAQGACVLCRKRKRKVTNFGGLQI
jgi:hypothetical protein